METANDRTWKEQAAAQKPANSPLSVHVKGWCKRIGGQLVVIAGKVSHDDAMKRYHLKMVAHNANQGLGGTAIPQAIPAPAPAQIAPVSPKASTITVRQLRDKFLMAKHKLNVEGKFSDRSYQTLAAIVDRYVKAYGSEG